MLQLNVPIEDPARLSCYDPHRVVIINDLSSPKGGATSIALTNAKELVARGISVTFITGDNAHDIRPEHKDIDFIPISGPHLLEGSRLVGAARGIYSLKTFRFVADWIRHNDTVRTIYHLHGWSKIFTPSVFSSLRPVNHRLVVHAHDHFLVCPNGGYFNYPDGRGCALTPQSLSCIASNCDRRSYSHKLWRTARQRVVSNLFIPQTVGAVIPVHQEMVPLLALGGIPKDRMTPVRNPVQPWCSERVSAESNSKVLYVGRLDSDKGVLQLANAARLAGIQLRMIGTGPLAKTIERAYPEIELCGWRDPKDIRELCKDSRLLVMPSTCRETFGLAIFEALRSGLPAVVSTHVMAAKEIEQANMGVSFDPYNSDEFSSLLKQLSNDSELIETLSRNAFLRSPALAPSAQEWCEQLLSIYRRLS